MASRGMLVLTSDPKGARMTADDEARLLEIAADIAARESEFDEGDAAHIAESVLAALGRAGYRVVKLSHRQVAGWDCHAGSKECMWSVESEIRL